jgi:DNA primase
VEKLYHCFGCGAGGDVFSFVMATEGLDFAGALESLADRAGIELEREAEDPADAARRMRRDRLLALLERTAAYYVRVLWESGEAARARAYLAERGLEEAVLREYRVGYSPSRWDRVLLASRSAGFSEEELLAAGLSQRGRDGRGVFDRFRGRIMFPLCDLRGHVLGFGARAVSPDQRPKYLNTSDGELFHKGRIVYGADLARAPAAKAARVVLVEGYTDVIALRQAGVPEAVCSMGTALTDAQVDVLAKLAPRVLFCQDPDAAGQDAIDRSKEALKLHNQRRRGTAVDVRIVRLPAGRDPADVVQAEGAAAIGRLLESAVPVERFEVERALEEGELETTEGRDAALTAAAGAIDGLPPSVLRDELVKLVADRLNVTASLVESAIADPARRATAAAARRAAADAARRREAGASRGHDASQSRGHGGGSSRGHDAAPSRGYDGRDGQDAGSAGGHDGPARGFDDPGPEPGSRQRAVNGTRRALDRREQTERAFLAYCLALPDEGERRLAEADLDELFASPETRRAAEYLRGRVRAPAADLPPDDEALARLVAELVIRAGQLEATPAKLELEALQLDLSRLDRLIAGARATGGEGVRELAVQRQVVLDQIRHRLT